MLGDILERVARGELDDTGADRAEAYRRGYEGLGAISYITSHGRGGYAAAVLASRDWRAAAADHAATSGFPAPEHVWAMRAYWLGVARGILARDPLVRAGWHSGQTS